MKTHEFARHLEQLAQLLRQLPDTELDRASLLQGVLPGMESVRKGKATAQKETEWPEDIEAQLQAMSPSEIEKFLLSEEKLITAASLSRLAERLGLPSNKRQSKDALVNMITRHFEAIKMHSIMRSARSNDSSENA